MAVLAALCSFASPLTASTPGADPLGERAPARRQAATDGQSLRGRALAGDADAATELGRMFARGEGLAYDAREAMRWLSRGADGGSVAAKRELGLLLLRGRDIPKEAERAAGYLREAAEADDPSSHASAGLFGKKKLKVFFFETRRAT